jgi:DNA-binding response OmpR family regulator
MATILVVEDEITVLALVESVLKHAGFETLTASTLAEAQAILNSDKKIDLVFTDVNLGDQAEGGVIVSQVARQINPALPIVFATARSITDGMEALQAPPCTFLPKPYTDENIINTVSALLRGDDPP